MPFGRVGSWQPTKRTQIERLQQELAKYDAKKLVEPVDPIVEERIRTPLRTVARIQPAESVFTTPEIQRPQTIPTLPVTRNIVSDAAPPPAATPTPAPNAEIATQLELQQPQSFLQRIGSVFAAPFEWVDEFALKPALSLVGSALGVVPDVERDRGEDFWDWKRRAWEEWDAPGVKFDMPWGDWNVDVKGVAEIVPWLLIPGAGQVGGITKGVGVLGKIAKAAPWLVRAGESAGIAGLAGRIPKVGKLLGGAIEMSPWGLTEKTAGVALRKVIGGSFAATGKLSTAVGERVFGKYVEPEVPAVVSKFTTWMERTVLGNTKTFRKAVKEELRPRQAGKVGAVLKGIREGADPLEGVGQLGTALSGGVKKQFALTAEKLAAREAKEIERIQLRVARGDITDSVGQALITKTKNKFAQFEPADIKWTADDARELLNPLISAAERDLTLVRPLQDLKALLMEGIIPPKASVRIWAQVYGPEFARAVGKAVELGESRWKKIIDFANVPRAILASGEMSGTLRQNMIHVLSHPLEARKWMNTQVRSFASDKLANEFDDVLRATPGAKELQRRSGQQLPSFREGPGSALATEAFSSAAARKLPGVIRSERAFVNFGNHAKVGVWDMTSATWKAAGATEKELNLLADYIFNAGGRGKLPGGLEKYAPVFNAFMFAPKFQVAKFGTVKLLGQMIAQGATDPAKRFMLKEAARAIVPFMGGGAALLGLLNATGAAKIETDPRASDFGKIRFATGKMDADGNPIYSATRIDVWTGYLQYARFGAQMLTGQSKSAFGNLNPKDRFDTAFRFVQSKASPAAQWMVDLLKGETFMGEPVFSDTTGFSRTAKERLLPLFLQDMMDAVEQSGFNSVGTYSASSAFFGIGVLTYINDLVRERNKVAEANGYDSWEGIDDLTQARLERESPELQKANLEYDRESLGTTWGNWNSVARSIDQGYAGRVDQLVAKYRQDGDGVAFRKAVTDANIAKRGAYNARETDEQFLEITNRFAIENPADRLMKLGPEKMAVQAYHEALNGDDMFDEFGDYRYDLADQRHAELRVALGDDLYEYVQELSSVKYEGFPAEFKELQRAKEVMRPYWDVTDGAEQTLGYTQKEAMRHPAKERRFNAFVARLRLALRRSNPEIEKAFQRFYSSK